jgi:hypothetical protein
MVRPIVTGVRRAEAPGIDFGTAQYKPSAVRSRAVEMQRPATHSGFPLTAVEIEGPPLTSSSRRLAPTRA